jgi:hypothetical protein
MSLLLILEAVLTAIWVGVCASAFWRVALESWGVAESAIAALGLLLLALALLALSLFSESTKRSKDDSLLRR